MAYKTGRSRTVTLSGTTMGVAVEMFNDAQLDPFTEFPHLNVTDLSLSALGVSIAANGSGGYREDLPSGPYDFNYRWHVPISISGPGGGDDVSGELLQDYLPAGSDPDGADVFVARMDLAGTWTITADVEQWIEDSGVLDPHGFMGGVMDAPPGTKHRTFECLKLGGAIHAELSIGDSTLTYDHTVAAGEDLEIGTSVAASASQHGQATNSTGFYSFWLDHQEEIDAGFTIDQPGYYRLYTQTRDADDTYDAGIITTDSQIACRFVPGDGIGQVSISAALFLDKVANVELRVQGVDAGGMTLGTSYPTPLRAILTGFPGLPYVDFTGSWTYTLTQRKWDTSGTIGSADYSDGVDEYAAVRITLDSTTLESVGELPMQWRVLLHGKQWDAVSLSQARSYIVDDCSALADSGTTPAGDARTGTWAAGSHTTLSLATVSDGSITHAVQAAVSGGTGSLVRTFDPAQVLTGYRYLPIRMRTVGSAHKPFNVTIVNNGASKTWTKDRHGSALQTGTDGTFGDIIIDLCQPDSSDRLDTTDTSWERRWRNDDGDIEGSVDGAYFGVTYADSLSIGGLEDGCTYQIDYLGMARYGATDDVDGTSKFDCLPTFYPSQLRTGPFDAIYAIQDYPQEQHARHTNDSGTDFIYKIRRGFLANTDGRQSLELEDISYTKVIGEDTTSYVEIIPTIAEFVGKVNSTLSGPNRGSGGAPLEPVDTGVAVFPGWTATDLKPNPGGDPPDPALAEDWYYCSDRVAAWLGAQGLRWVPGGTWASAIDIDCTSGATIPAIPLYDSVDWYPGCGDVFEHGGAPPVYGEQIILKATRVMRAAAHGLTLSPDHHPAASVDVAVQRVSDSLAEGSGSSEANGDYKTGADYAFGYTADPPDPDTGDILYHPVDHFVTADDEVLNRATIAMYPRHRYRACFVVIPTGPTANPSNHNYVLGFFHRVQIQSGGVRHRRSDTPGGVFVVNTQVTTDATDTDPHIVTDWRGTLRLLFCRPASGILETYSNDEGVTWSDPAVAITGGKHPVCPVGHAGEIFRAAYVSGELKGYIEYPGSTTALTTFKDSSGTALTVEDDTFGLSAAHEGAGRWFLSVRIAGEGAVSDWYCADAEDGNTWTRIT